MKISRRNFIKSSGLGLLGAVIAHGVNPAKLQSSTISTSGSPVVKMSTLRFSRKEHFWRFIVDIHKCIGCGKCVRACKLENDVPMDPEVNRTWVERYVITEEEEYIVDSPNGGIDGFTADHMNKKYENLDIEKSFFVPKLCNQCDVPPCVQVCPVGATYSTKEGVVLVDRKACIGCRYCIMACPYGARFLDHRHKVVDKCTWCYHRITKGLLPACVEVCPTGARSFGKIDDPESPISKAIKEHEISVLKPEVGCEAKVLYIGFDKGVR